ncbi:hypothetical protein B484DRAFT_341222, partial [Ochromonadaceae sp. CCMP2298]
PKYAPYTTHIHPKYTPNTPHIRPIYAPYTPHIRPIYAPYTPHNRPIYASYTPHIRPIYTPYTPQIHPPNYLSELTFHPSLPWCRLPGCVGARRGVEQSPGALCEGMGGHRERLRVDEQVRSGRT